MAKYKCIVEYEYPVDHKPPVKAEIILHGDSVTSNNVTPFTDRPHGEWKYAIVDCYKSGYICTHCNGFAVIDGKSDGYSVTFCPNCGSDNRQKEGEANDTV